MAGRTLRSTPIVAIVTIVSLALGIGASTAIFSVLNGMTLRRLPVSDPDRLVTITSNTALGLGFQAGGGWNYAMWERFKDHLAAFSGGFTWTMQRIDSTPSGEIQPMDVLFASGDVFATLGVRAALGRTFTAADDVRGGGADGAVAVISHDFWQERFNGSPAVLGMTLPIDGVPFSIIGVTPAGFLGVDVGQGFDVAVPLGAEPLIRGLRALVNTPQALVLTVMLRLQHDQSLREATAALRTMQPHIVAADAPEFLREPFVLVPASTGISDRTGLRQRYQRPLLTLAVVGGLVLLLVCLNVANVLLARAAARRGEFSVRLALGARRSALVRQLLVESAALALPGALVGIVFAAWASRVLVSQLPAAAVPVTLNVSIDGMVLAFTTVLTMGAMTVCGIAPAFHATRTRAIESLQDMGRGLAGGRQRIASLLVVAQIAVSIVLVVAAGLFAGTAARLARVPLGFDADGVLVMTINSARAAIDPGVRLAFHQRMVDTVAAVPGVTRAAASQWTPMSGAGGGGLLSDARGRRLEAVPQTAFNFVTPGWFAAYGTPIRAGRDVDPRDTASSSRVALINETLSAQVFPGARALGRSITVGPCGRDGGCEVVGVVGDALYGRSLRDAPPPTVYVPLAQASGALPPNNTTVRISMRIDADASAVIPRLAAAVRDMDGDLAFSFHWLRTDVEGAFAQERLVAMLAMFFGTVAALLAALGLYGVTAYAVTRRRTEIGVRLALGATPRDAVVMVLRRVAALVGTGAALGVALSVWLSSFVAPLLYGLTPRDPATLLAAVLALGAVATGAAWIPAARASRCDPGVTLRQL